jgi:hypothetical protein
MRLVESFKAAEPADIRKVLGIRPDKRACLLVTGLDLSQPIHASMANGRNMFRVSLPQNDVDESLNAITQWMRGTGALYQQPFYENRLSYNISFYLMPGGVASYPSLQSEFVLEDYVFGDCRADAASCFDELMRMLDRDKMAEAMRRSLMEDFGMRQRNAAPVLWRMHMRQCNHPDHAAARAEPAVCA